MTNLLSIYPILLQHQTLCYWIMMFIFIIINCSSIDKDRYEIIYLATISLYSCIFKVFHSNFFINLLIVIMIGIIAFFIRSYGKKKKIVLSDQTQISLGLIFIGAIVLYLFIFSTFEVFTQ